MTAPTDRTPTADDLVNFGGLCAMFAFIAGAGLAYGLRRWLTVKPPRGGWG
jgi:hypothetical protein